MGIVNDPLTTLEEKITILISHYIDMLVKNPDLPIFVLSEIKENPESLVSRLGFDSPHFNPFIVKQWKEKVLAGTAPKVNPMHLVINVLSLTIFPFIASPLFRNRTGISLDEFNKLMEERKKLIPIWVKGMMAVG
jgi:hypothetical protein